MLKLDEISTTIVKKRISHKVNYVSSSSKNTFTAIDDSLLVPSQSHILQSLSIKTSNLNVNLLRAIKLQNKIKEIVDVLEDNEIYMDVDKWGGRRK